MSRNVLLVGRTADVLDDVRNGLAGQEVTVFCETTLDDARRTLDEQSIDTVIMGAGIDIETRLQIIRHAFAASTATTVHLKDRASGPRGMLPFVKAVLAVLAPTPPTAPR